MITVIDCKMLAILVLVGLLISRFQVQVLMGARLAGDFNTANYCHKDHKFFTRFSISNALGSRYPIVVERSSCLSSL